MGGGREIPMPLYAGCRAAARKQEEYDHPIGKGQGVDGLGEGKPKQKSAFVDP